jgi:hypothetical protein
MQTSHKYAAGLRKPAASGCNRAPCRSRAARLASGDDHPHRHLLLRPAARHRTGRAGPRCDLSLPGLSATHRQRFRGAGALASGSGEGRGRDAGVATHRRGRWRCLRLPLLPNLWLDRLVHPGRRARLHRRRRRLLRRTQLPGPGPLNLRPPSPSLGGAGRGAAVVDRARRRRSAGVRRSCVVPDTPDHPSRHIRNGRLRRARSGKKVARRTFNIRRAKWRCKAGGKCPQLHCICRLRVLFSTQRSFMFSKSRPAPA